jgi:DNA-binding MarR family transcriptional regulator
MIQDSAFPSSDAAPPAAADTPAAVPTPAGAPLALDQQLCFAVYSAAHAFNRAYKPLLDALHLTYPQYLVMLVLWQDDGRTVKAIGDKLHLDSGTLTPLLKRLEAAGLLRRSRDAADERQVLVQLTAAGWALRVRAEAVPGAMFCATGSDIAEVVSLRDAIGRLRDRLLKAAGG